MASLNKVLLIGNLTKDPELRYTPAGIAVANLRLAVNRKYKDKSGESASAIFGGGKYDDESRKKKLKEEWNRLKDEGTKLQLSMIDIVKEGLENEDKYKKKTERDSGDEGRKACGSLIADDASNKNGQRINGNDQSSFSHEIFSIKGKCFFI